MKERYRQWWLKIIGEHKDNPDKAFAEIEAEIRAELLGEVQRFTIEEEIDGWALYQGRDMNHHGAKLCILTRFASDGPEVREMIVTALNAAPETMKIDLGKDTLNVIEKMMLRDEITKRVKSLFGI